MTEIADALERFRMALHGPIDWDAIASHVDRLVTLLTPRDSGSYLLSPGRRERIIVRDLMIHVERWRAVNEVTDDSQVFEDNALEALELLTRRERETEASVWTAARKYQAEHPECVSLEGAAVCAYVEKIINALERQGMLIGEHEKAALVVLDALAPE